MTPHLCRGEASGEEVRDGAIASPGQEAARDVQMALINILEDSEAEKGELERAQRATLNVLADFSEERRRLTELQTSVFNILEDFAEEKARMEETSKALLNILEDVAEKDRIERLNREMALEIAERKRVEEELRRERVRAEEANHELEAFSYSVAHDLRAPLRSIDGFSQALFEDCEDRLSDDGKTYIRYVRESALQMAELIDDLLGLARVSRADLDRRSVDLARMARRIFRRLKRVGPNRLVEVVIPDQLLAEGDERLLGVVVDNLVGNAWKFTSKRTRARIEIGSRQLDGHATYFVRDNGSGFDMTYASKLFGVFQRLHPATEFEGTGIGLATVQRIIHRHGGRVWGEGEVDRGATFYFTLGGGPEA